MSLIKFKKYVAAVEQARIMSKGSGETNELDHVAKDLHKEGFDEEMEELSKSQIKEYWEMYKDEVFSIARERYGM